HPFVVVPQVHTELSGRRVLVSEYVEGLGFEAVKQLPDGERDRFAEILFRFFYGLLEREALVAGDPHPGNVMLLADGRVCFLDFGLMRRMSRDYLEGERELARALIDRDADRVHALLARLGYLPDPPSFEPERLLRQLTDSTEWWLEPGERRLDPAYVRELTERASSPRSPSFDLMRRQTIPPEALLLRRMEGMLFAVLGELRACADWHALATESLNGGTPTTPLGDEEAAWLAGSAACSP
ncbi:MAG TPA: AarF/UbiB family protein, partial [Capillimicrobium sp.]|nr:AarF/UbiB family protein [Capillimicrobium sp.]